MSAVVNRPRVNHKTGGGGNRRVYTLHSGTNDIFGWRLKDESVKTVTVAFKNQKDAIMMAHMFERHIIQRKEWPDTLLMEDAFRISMGPPPESPPGIIEVRSWTVDKLKRFCVNAYLDMIVLETIQRADDTYKLSGEIMSLATTDEHYVERLTKLYQIGM